MMNHPELDMAYMTPEDVLVHVLKEFDEYRKFPPQDRIKEIKVNQFFVLDCIQWLASGKKEICEEFNQNKALIAAYLKEEISGSYTPRFVVSPPSRRTIARDLAALLAVAYECIDLSILFSKQNSLITAGAQGATLDSLVENVICTSDLSCIQNGDSILIVDDVFSTGKSIDCMKEKIIRLSHAHGLSFRGAAILKV
jgi:hypothetical protein